MATMPNGMTTGSGDVQDFVDEPIISPCLLLALAYSWSNVTKDQLVNAGVIGPGAGGSDWKRFNDDPMMFVLKLPPERLPALCKLLD